MAFHPGGVQLAARLGTNGVSVWATSNWQPLFTLRPLGGEVTTLAISPDGKRLVAVGERAAWVWEVQSGRRIRAFPEDSLSAFAPPQPSTNIRSKHGRQCVRH